MFCSKCGKTLRPDADRCSCGQAVGESRFEGVPYTSAQVRIVPGAFSYAAGETLPYTRTTYTGKDEQMQLDADADARTTYRPVYEGASVPEEIRGDVRRAVGDEGEKDAPAPDDNPLVREMFEEDGGEGGIDDFDLSQLRSRPIVSDGRAGISRDVSEYVEQLEATVDRGSRRSRRRRVYGDEPEEGAPAPAYGEMDESAFAELPEEEQYQAAPRGGTRLMFKIIGALAAVAVVAVVGKIIFDRVADIQNTSASPIAGVGADLYEQGVALINQHADTAYAQTLVTQGQNEGVLPMTAALTADAEAIEALLPEDADTDAQTFVAALSAIQTNIGNAVTMDFLALTDTTRTNEEKIEQSTSNWQIVRNAIAELTAASSTAELTSIVGGDVIEVIQPEAGATATPVPYTTLTRGTSSNEVLRLQQRLYELGYLNDNIDGVFGNNTQTAVKLFQSAVGLETTGIADAAMQTALYADDAPRTQYAQPTPTPTTAPTPEPTAQPAADGGESGGGEDAPDGGLEAEPTLLAS